MNFHLPVVTCCLVLLISLGLETRSEQTRQHRELSFNSASRQPAARSKRMADNDHENRITDEKLVKQNEVENDRITIGEPYKSIIQTTARFALAQSQVTKHVNIDTAMSLISDTAFFLSKPIVLLRALKVVAVSLGTFLATLILFPGVSKFAEAAWQDPTSVLDLDRYLTNGLKERSVLAAIGSKTDETLSRVGLQDYSCRQRSICYMGEIMKCSFPNTAETITKFASDNFSGSSIKDNVYARAFISGFVDRNCTGVGSMSQQDTNSCLSNFFNSILSGTKTNASPRKK